MILLDTDVMIDVLRQFPPAITWIKSLGDEELLLPGFVVMELIDGCVNKVEQRKLRSKLSGYSVAWPSSQACDQALGAFAERHLSHGLGIIDSLIGHTALELDAALHTFNRRHYSAIAGLRTEQPYEKSP